MTTLVGTQKKFEDALYELCELDFDAVEAYEAAIERLEKEKYKIKLRQFRDDHVKHTQDISNLLSKHQIESPKGPGVKTLLAKGKVIFANILGDEAILKAMLSNEKDTNTAYERVIEHDEIWEDSKEILRGGLEDERRHKQWIQLTLNGFK